MSERGMRLGEESEARAHDGWTITARRSRSPHTGREADRSQPFSIPYVIQF